MKWLENFGVRWSVARAISGLNTNLAPRLTITTLDLPNGKSFNLGLSVDFSTGRRTFGGTSPSLRIAAEKAISEVCESWAIRNSNFNLSDSRSGWAAHPNLDEAVRSAKLELVERDAFILNYLSDTLCGEALNVDFFSPQTQTTYSLASLKNRGRNLYVVMAVSALSVEGPKTIGLGTAESQSTAAEKALTEAILIDLFWRKIDQTKAGSDYRPLLREHWNASKTLECLKKLERMSGKAPCANAFNNDLPPFDSNQFKITYSEQLRNGRYVVKLEHAQLIRLKFGSSWRESETPVLEEFKRLKLEGSFAMHPML